MSAWTISAYGRILPPTWKKTPHPVAPAWGTFSTCRARRRSHDPAETSDRNRSGDSARWKRAPLLLGLLLVGIIASSGDAAAPPEKERPAAASGLFGDFDDAKDYPTAESLRALLVQAPGEPYEVAEVRKWERPIRRISGLLRLSAPWPVGSALRLSVLDPQQFQLHLWNGTQGVTLRYYPDYHQTWAAYATTREPGKPRPSDYALWATSEDYYRRSGIGTVEVHVQAGHLFLVRGDLTLLSVPMENPPSEIYFEGTALVRGLAWAESKFVPEPTPVRPTLFKSDRPAELAWDLNPAEGVALHRLPDGRIELAADEKAKAAQALAPLEAPGIGEFIFEVEDADVGTGVCLADAEGKPICRVGFFRHRETGKRVFDILPNWAHEMERNFNGNKQPVPYAGKRQWLRLVCGAGIFKLFTSGDGIAWRQPSVHSPGLEGTCAKVGLFCLAAPQKRAIQLRFLAVRRFDSLDAGVPKAVLDDVPPLPKRLARPEEWQTWVDESRPADVSPPVWWRACALRTLSGGAGPQIAQPVLTQLQQSVLEESPGQDTDRLVQFMSDTALLYASEDWAAMDRLVPEARRFGGALVCRGETMPFTAVSRAMMRWPIWTPRRLPVFPDDLLRQELFLRAGQDREEPLGEFCRRMRYWSRTGGPRQWDEPVSAHAEYLIQWADPVRTPEPGKRRRGRRPLRPPSYQAANPLIEQIGKEGFNTISEIRAAVDGRAWREACQIITSVPNPQSLGLVPDSHDPRVLVSFTRALAREMEVCPELAKTMVHQFGKIGRLRFKEATSAGDEAAVQAVVAQFPATPVASEARRWLGDRRLAAGRFTEAVGYYRRAALTAPAEEREALAARDRLAGALLGQDWGRPLESPVQLGSTSFSASEFEQMIAGLRQSHRAPGAASAADAAGIEIASRGFPPGRYELRSWASMEESDLKRPAMLPDKAIDWVGRQTAVLATARHLIVSNQTELAAFDLGTGQQRWSLESEAGEQSQRWPLVPMRPLAFGERILVRRLTSDGAELACVESATGKVVWTSKPDEYVASDPVLVDDRPMALCCTSQEGGGKISLSLVEFDAATGRVRKRVPLAEFRDSGRRALDCQMVVADDRLIATAAGCVLAFTPAGRVHWIRRQVWVPPAGPDYQNSREWLAQYHEPLQVAGGRVYATQPGVWGIECLQVDNGHLVWRQGVGNLTRLVGRIGDRLIVETSDGPTALNAETGKVLWMRQIKHCLAVRMCSQPSSVVCLGIHDSRSNRRETPDGIALSWYNAEDGKSLGTWVMEAHSQPAWLLGPLAAAGNRQWLSLGSRQEPARRELPEIVLTGTLE